MLESEDKMYPNHLVKVDKGKEISKNQPQISEDEKYLDGLIRRDQKVLAKIYELVRSGIISRISKRFGNISESDLLSLIGHCLIMMYDSALKYKRTGFKKGFLQCFVGMANITWIVWYRWNRQINYLEDISFIKNDFESSLSHYYQCETDKEVKLKCEILMLAYKELRKKDQKVLSHIFKGHEISQKELVEIMNLHASEKDQIKHDAFRQKKLRAVRALIKIYFHLKDRLE